jgi:diguanylate cyclase (GGDEF)-like protein
VISDLSFSGRERLPVVAIATPFATRFGRRVGVQVTPAEVVHTFAAAYLAGASAVRGGRAYLIDGHGRIVGSSEKLRQGVDLPDRKLAAALHKRQSGTLGSSYFASSGVRYTHWRVVLSAPHSALLAPVEGTTRRTAWILFAAFGLALIALLGVGASALLKSGQLAEARAGERSASQLAHERLHDALTGLPNRALFLDRTERALAIATRTRRAIGVLFIDLDRFKRINDSLGHAAGDELLVTVAARLRDTVRPGDTVSRFGGDEFLILCEEIDEAEELLHIAQGVQGAFEMPFEVGRREVELTCCVGLHFHASQVGSVEAAAVVRDADTAMYRAKAQGPGSVKLFDADLHAEALRKLDTEVALRSAVHAGELRVYYQPIVELPAGRIRGVEALVRWQRPGVGLVAPLDFIGLAEECGAIQELGRWVLESAMSEVAAWADDGLVGPAFALSVNVSAHQLVDPDFEPLVARLVESWSRQPSCLWLELTESAVSRDPQVAKRALNALGALGVGLAIDDFGAGHSALHRLVRLIPVTILKLDGSFVSHMADFRERAVVAAVAQMAEALRMTPIAEGVETAEQATELAALGYPLAQGYYFGRPMDAAAARRTIASAEAVTAAPRSAG